MLENERDEMYEPLQAQHQIVSHKLHLPHYHIPMSFDSQASTYKSHASQTNLIYRRLIS